VGRGSRESELTFLASFEMANAFPLGEFEGMPGTEGEYDQVIPTARVAIPETPFVPPVLPGQPIRIIRNGRDRADSLHAELAELKETRMLLDRPEAPAESRGFVHQRIIGGIGGLLSGGPVGGIAGFLGGGGGGGGVIPTGSTDFSSNIGPAPAAPIRMRPQGIAPSRFTMPFGLPCIPPTRKDPITGECKMFLGEVPGPDEAPRTRLNGQFRGAQHHPHAPVQVATTVRRCGPGHVLSWEGMCVSKRDIRNSDRMYPKPPRPLGTRSELKAVRVASSFGRRLKSNEKRLKKLGRALGVGR